MHVRVNIKRILGISMPMLMLGLSTAFGQEVDAPEDDSDYQSGFEDVPQFGGPEGVSGQLEEGDQKRAGVIQSRVLDPWFEWKGKLQDEHGVALGVFTTALYQNADDTLPGQEDDALGSVARFYGTWTLFDRGGSNPGYLEWRLENRSDLGGLQSPQQLGGAVGARALNTGFGYSENFKTDMSVLAWTQILGDGTAGITAGRLAFDAYLDSMAFQSTSVGFLNRSFLVNPTLGTTGIGALGIVSKGFVTDHLFVGAHIYDGNAESGEWDWDTVEEREFLKAVEIGWAGSIATRRQQKIAFTYWEKDSRDEVGISDGDGWAISWNWKFEKWFPFVRIGHSDGGAGVAAENALSGGFEYTVNETGKWSLGAGWAEPANAITDDDEYVLETSYAFQVAKNLELLTDVQLLLDPANDPSNSSVWVASLRVLITL